MRSKWELTFQELALEGSEDAAQRVLNAKCVINRLPDVLTGIEALVETCGIPRSGLGLG